MLVELGLGLLEQRHKAVLEVLGGASVTDVACRRVARQTLHDWPRRYEEARRSRDSRTPSSSHVCDHEEPQPP